MVCLTSQLALEIPCLCLLRLELQLLLTQDFMEVSGDPSSGLQLCMASTLLRHLSSPLPFFEAGSLYIVLDVLILTW